MSFTIPQPKLGLSRKEIKSYSLLRAFNCISKGNWNDLGLEREVSDEISNRLGRKPRGLFVPQELGWSKRDLTVGTNTAGGFLKGTDHMGDSFVDALREQSVVFNLGAKRMTGLQGDVSIPALNAKTSTYWVAESGAPTEGAPTVRQITMSPKTVGAYVDLSRKLMLQSDPSAEEIFRNDMISQVAVAVDSAGINGGGSNEPTGILQTSGIGSVAIGTNGGAPTWASVVDLVKEVAVDNALNGSLAFLTNPQVAAKMRSTVRVSSTDSKMILDDSNELFGYKVYASSLVPSNLSKGTSSGVCSAMIFGNFNDLIIGQWGGLDAVADPFTHSSTGGLRITCFLDVDVAVRHAESFAAVQDLTT